MELILNNLSDPSWWFTGLFFSFLLYLINVASKFISSKLKKLNRRRKAKRLRGIKNLRTSQSSIVYEISKANSYFILFVIVCCLFLFWFVSGPLNQIAKVSKLAALLISSPIIMIEILWLIQDEFARDLIEYSRKFYKPVFLSKK